MGFVGAWASGDKRKGLAYTAVWHEQCETCAISKLGPAHPTVRLCSRSTSKEERTFRSKSIYGGEAPVWVKNGGLAARQPRPLTPQSRPSRCEH
jgi:hypothetical protein